ncbi:MAG: sulfoxide reductase heme-binding subunit YedZ [Gammaproteobacteria bacterium]|nr:sulfoxide reductase heme-binding subunit YedZ [Gammaproteobacteria bacterium]MYA66083.1 sulfoxide reductase heme-binding subunit YedZ [Gammaproteobacteria bacterium]MYH45991.1 sulfoxide reductase heme-binding subunit YedZ [Gammaproteobacteria bacterium]MYL14557.1 sulfoxide reductase heme-binding subunit YedZ [Gammaproteobacteria bacterium]
MAQNPARTGWLKPAVFSASLIPLAWLIWRIAADDLGPDPAQELAITTGEWTLRFLLITLSLTPLRHISGQLAFVRVRRMVGLFALFYASIHFTVWMSLLLGFRWFAIGEELLERPYITIGFLALLILIALGVTSPKAAVRRMGKNWKRLHRLIYLAAMLAIVHLTWILRTDVSEAVLYGSILAILLGYRLYRRFGRSGKQMARR